MILYVFYSTQCILKLLCVLYVFPSQLAQKGIEIEKKAIEKVFELGTIQDNPTKYKDIFRQLGSHYVTDSEGVAGLWEEFNLLKNMKAKDIAWMDEKDVASEHGAAAGFVAGIKFPYDAIVNSSEVNPHRSIY